MMKKAVMLCKDDPDLKEFIKEEEETRLVIDAQQLS